MFRVPGNYQVKYFFVKLLTPLVWNCLLISCNWQLAAVSFFRESYTSFKPPPGYGESGNFRGGIVDFVYFYDLQNAGSHNRGFHENLRTRSPAPHFGEDCKTPAHISKCFDLPLQHMSKLIWKCLPFKSESVGGGEPLRMFIEGNARRV